MTYYVHYTGKRPGLIPTRQKVTSYKIAKEKGELEQLKDRMAWLSIAQ